MGVCRGGFGAARIAGDRLRSCHCALGALSPGLKGVARRRLPCFDLPGSLAFRESNREGGAKTMADCRPAWLVGILACVACAPSTQITFDIRTDVPCGDIQSVGITVGPTGSVEGKDPVVVTSECTEEGDVRVIGTYSVVPQAIPVDVTVRVTLASKGVNLETDCTAQAGYRGCIVGRRALTFIPRRNLVVPIELLLVCRGVACDEFTTCNRAGRCVSARVDINRCEGDLCATTVEGPNDGLPTAVATFSSLTIAPETTVADGVSAALVSLRLADSLGAPLVNVPVTFGSNGSTNLWSTSSSMTDDSGTFTAKLASLTAERKTVVVSGSGLTLSAGVAFVSGDAGATTPGVDGGDGGRDAGPAVDAGSLPGADGGFCRNANDCDDGVFCNGLETCISARCSSSIRPFCDDENPCSVDMCNESARTCTYTAAFVDSDGDGHYPIACGGTADDCDDGDAFTWGGPLPAPERCDFKDNNCNGNFDEGLWLEKAGSRLAITSGGLYPIGVGPPAVLRVGSSIYVAAASDSTGRGSIDVFQMSTNDLSIVSGPVATVASTTPWVSAAVGQATYAGRRVAKPALVDSTAGDLMVTGLAKSWPNPTTCSPGDSFLTSGFARLSPNLVLLGTGDTNNYRQTFSSCLFLSPVVGETAVVLWVPAINSWAFVTPVYRGGPAVNYPRLYLEIQLLGASGILTTSRRLLDDGPTVDGASVRNESDPNLRSLPKMALGPLGVMVMWEDFTYGLRYAIFSFDFTAVVAGPFTIPNLSSFNLRNLTFDGVNFIATLNDTTGNIPRLATLLRFQPNGVRRLENQPLPGTTWAPVSAPGSLVSGLDSALIVVDSGKFLFSASSGLTGLDFGWSTNQSDAGFLSISVPIASPHSDFSLAPIDNKNVAVFWVDGDLKRTIMQCAP